MSREQSGVEADLVSALGEWSPIPVTYAGGARSLADLEVVSRLGKGKVNRHRLGVGRLWRCVAVRKGGLVVQGEGYVIQNDPR